VQQSAADILMLHAPNRRSEIADLAPTLNPLKTAQGAEIHRVNNSLIWWDYQEFLCGKYQRQAH